MNKGLFSVKRSRVAWAIAMFSASLCAQVAHALPGPAPAGTAIAEYNRTTGIIVVSVASVSNWYVQSASAGMTGPGNLQGILPRAATNALVSNSDFRVGELLFGGSFTYTDLNLGAVAATSLPAGDLNVFWNAGGTGNPLLSQPVVYVGAPTLQGDFNADNKVDGTDFLIWQRGGSPNPVSAGDFGLWQANFGTSGSLASVSGAPEPTSALLTSLICLGCASCRRRSSGLV